MDDPPFTGKIGETHMDSTQAWPQLPKPPADAPNVVIILLDDVGFGQVGTFGGPVPTPALDQLASKGLKYNRFHTTAICEPSRAALLTGRNHHNCGSGLLAEYATGFPSYTTMMPKSTATIGKILKENGYNTAWFGKNHNTPTERRLPGSDRHDVPSGNPCWRKLSDRWTRRASAKSPGQRS